jgi:hypothetical protein
MVFFRSQNMSWHMPTQQIAFFRDPIQMEAWDSSSVIGIGFSTCGETDPLPDKHGDALSFSRSLWPRAWPPCGLVPVDCVPRSRRAVHAVDLRDLLSIVSCARANARPSMTESFMIRDPVRIVSHRAVGYLPEKAAPLTAPKPPPASPAFVGAAPPFARASSGGKCAR